MKTEKIYFGAAYYDEYMPFDRIDQDMQMMKAAGMNVIRIAESTWSTMEPKEGVYDFSHLDRMLEAAARYDLDVIIGTPTYAIPSWLAKKSEDILACTKNGQELYGHRQNMDLTSPIYRSYAEKIIRKLLEHVSQHPCVIGYQIDNETHHYGTAGERVQKMFVSYLQEKFPDIKEFNREFGLDYWSNRVDDWADFPDVRGTINGSLAAEFEKFQKKIVTDFHHWQAAIIDEYRTDSQFITHNFDFAWKDFSFGLHPDVNQRDCASCMTVAGCDIYHPSQDHLTGAEITACGNIIRGIKKDNYLILETQAQGTTEKLPYPDQLRLCAYSHLANGANSVMYWHWHSIHNSLESYWKGVLSHDFSAGATYREALKVGHELKEYGTHLVNLKKKNEVALILDYDSLTGLKHFPTGILGDFSYNEVVRWIGDSLYRANIEYDMVYTQDMDLSSYKLVFVPCLYSAAPETLQALKQYTAQGGHLVVTFRSGFSNEHLKIYADTQPYLLNECLGCHYDQFTLPDGVELAWDLPDNTDVIASAAETSDPQHSSAGACAAQTSAYQSSVVPTAAQASSAQSWMELVTADTTNVLARYDHYAWKDYAAVTENTYYSGKAYYIGCQFDNDHLDQLIQYISQQAKVQLFPMRFPVILKKGVNDFGKQVYYYLNYSGDIQKVVHTGFEGINLLAQTVRKDGDEIFLEPWGLQIIEEVC